MISCSWAHNLLEFVYTNMNMFQHVFKDCLNELAGVPVPDYPGLV